MFPKKLAIFILFYEVFVGCPVDDCYQTDYKNVGHGHGPVHVVLESLFSSRGHSVNYDSGLIQHLQLFHPEIVGFQRSSNSSNTFVLFFAIFFCFAAIIILIII